MNKTNEMSWTQRTLKAISDRLDLKIKTYCYQDKKLVEVVKWL